MRKALLMLSGGLDSTLAGTILLAMGLEVEAINFTSPFCRCTPKDLGCSAARHAAQQIGVPVHMVACGEDYIEVVKHPRHGRGSGVNPCLDCRIYKLRCAADYMGECGADFIATGEVLGQRPMSQHRQAMDLIERQAGLEGRILRPLSARLLPASLPEREGWVDRERLGTIQGRSRRPQMALAEGLGVDDYLCPSGGCLLTDKEFAARFRDLLEYEPDFRLRDARLLATGRHFRLPSGAKAVVARNEGECRIIEAAARDRDVLLTPVEVPAPSVLCRGPREQDDVLTAARLLATYTKGGPAVDVHARRNSADAPPTLLPEVEPLDRADAAPWRIAACPTRKRPQAKEEIPC
jgi:hypothetical protein